MHRASLLLPLLVGLAASASACGGIVVFDEGGSGGAGASGPTATVGPGTGPGSGPGTGPGTSTVSSSSGPSSACEYFCDRLAVCLGPEDCGEACASVYVPGCEAEADAYILCIADAVTVPDCSYEGGCEGLDAAYQACVGTGPGCTDFECFVGDGQCGCQGSCQGFEVGTGCEVQPNGSVRCNCVFDGSFIGSCEQGALDCSIEASCCQEVWFGFDDSPPQPG